MRAYIEKARERLEADPPDCRRAMAHLIAAIGQCTGCTDKRRHPKDKTCHVRQCAVAIHSEDPDALSNIAPKCSCGFSWPQCSAPDHIEAVDLLADALQQDQQWLQALAAALGLIRLDPTSAAGYCRVVKIILALEKAHRVARETKTPNPAAARWIASVLIYFDLLQPKQLIFVSKKVVQIGMRQTGGKNALMNRNQPDSVDYARVLQLMAHRFGVPQSRRDPAKILPLEIYQAVFSYLDPTSRSRALRVNRNWHALIMRSGRLWTHLDICSPSEVPNSTFASFLNKHPQIESLILRDLKKFGRMPPRKFSCILALPSLKRLILPRCSQAFVGLAPGAVILPQKLQLTQLCLSGFPVDSLPMLLKLTSGTLQALHLLKSPHGVDEVIEKVPMPHLRSLGVTGKTSRERLPSAPISIISLAKSTPNLQEFFVDDFRLCRRPGQEPFSGPQNPTSGAQTSINQYWKSLRAIKLGKRLVFQANPLVPHLLPRSFPPPTERMERIDIMTSDPAIAHNYLFTAEINGQTEHPTLHGEHFQGVLPSMPNLHTFRCRVAIEAPLLQQILELPAKKLRILELTILPTVGLLNSMIYRPTIPATGIGRPDQVLGWLRCENLDHVGLHDFNFCTDMSTLVGARFDGKPFTTWIENNFPKVTSVAAYAGDQPETDVYIASLISHPQKFKVVWQNAMHGVHWEMGSEMAGSHEVELRHWPKTVPCGPDMVDVSQDDHWDIIESNLWGIRRTGSRIWELENH
ncbi:hypothetical protein QBC43DRAFT_236180 [Cladorrhinum sp. PSN259]|nr:hypothetical protein QBC43DRAFT_236180 [Cladorrhinum sp. PSN259]